MEAQDQSPETPAPAAEETSVRPRPLIPRDQDQKAALAVFLAAAWKLNPQLVLLWTTQAEFEQKAQQFASALQARNKAGALRPQQTLTFDQYDEQIQEALDDVKGYIRELFGKEGAKNYYAEFGIEKRGEHYELPRGQKERADALDDLVTALTTHGLQDRKFGVAYWDPIADGYAALTGKARKAAATESKLVGIKNEQGEYIDEVLSAMLCLLEAHYRSEETLRAKQREMGYQREYN